MPDSTALGVRFQKHGKVLKKCAEVLSSAAIAGVSPRPRIGRVLTNRPQVDFCPPAWWNGVCAGLDAAVSAAPRLFRPAAQSRLMIRSRPC